MGDSEDDEKKKRLVVGVLSSSDGSRAAHMASFTVDGA